MKQFQLIEEGFIGKIPQQLLNVMQNLAILLSKITGFFLISNRVVDDILLLVLRILTVTLIAIDIAIPFSSMRPIWFWVRGPTHAIGDVRKGIRS